MPLLRSMIGNTPLIQVSPKIYAKLEAYSPSGSVKDRMVSYLAWKADERGEIKADTKFIEATSGNTGIALSMLGAVMGKEVHIIMPNNMSPERKQMMKAYGAYIHEVGPNDFKGAISKRNEMMREDPTWWSPMQFSNPDNVEGHRLITAPEIKTDLIKEVPGVPWEAFVHGAGTGGTMMGVAQYIKDHGFETKTVLTVPAESASEHGIQGINDGADFLLDRSFVDSVEQVTTKEAIERAKKLAREKGLLVGISSGANLLAAERWVQKNNPKGIVVTMLCDRGERYLGIYGKDL